MVLRQLVASALQRLLARRTHHHQLAGQPDARTHEPIDGGEHGGQAALHVGGQRVLNHHYDGCDNCKHCRAGWTQMCLQGTVVYGSGGNAELPSGCSCRA